MAPILGVDRYGIDSQFLVEPGGRPLHQSIAASLSALLQVLAQALFQEKPLAGKHSCADTAY